MIKLWEAVQITSAMENEILSNPHIQMGFEVEFVYVAPGVTSQTKAFKQVQTELTALGLKFGSKAFRLMPDTSIDTAKQPNHFGIELVGPPLPLLTSLQYLKQVFDWMQEHGHMTNSSTGLHVNVSVSNLDISQVDKLKLLLLMGEQHVQQLFDRLLNSYTQSHLEILKTAISYAQQHKQPWTQIREFRTLKHVLNASIDMDKYRTVNFSKLQNGYLEFRIMGNQDYHKRFETVKSVIVRYAYTLLAALDPHAFQTKYDQALSKLVSAGITQAQPVWPDLSHKYASVATSNKSHEQVKVLDYIKRAHQAVADNNPNSAVKLITMAIQRANKFAKKVPNDKLAHAAALSYSILIKKLFNWNVNQFVQAQKQLNMSPDVIKTVKTYLTKN